ncbi:metallophosphoesterase [Enterococcus sp. MJM12]|uniref:Phosphoesterase n=1 Tax=Candidatus Enterococcus myersii TaxID=2815322 RepID=A0ABS3H4W3_9ENTE|nr:metallophosphoesterase [Enterococcus sp. MJM12]MBO0448495.1 metallophosphoesterase [Enterococcus sp. MJM12]
MKYLVVSDNHGDREILVDILQRRRDEVDYFFHCGDSELPSNDELFQTYNVVTGNCDFDPGFKSHLVMKTPLDTIYMTHGHLSNVRFGLTQISLEAKAENADICLFGHTHQIGCEAVKGCLYLNPGSISQPRGPIQIQSYAIIESSADSWEVQYYDRAHAAVSDLHFHFKK